MAAKLDSEADFAVVGAGLAGLRTAADLAAAGASVTVFEARDRVGGRVLSAPRNGADTAPQLVLDLGAQWVGPGQTEILGLIDELGLHVVPTAVPGRAIWCLDGGDVKESGGAYPPLPPHALAEVLFNRVRLARMSKRVAPEAPWRASNSQRWDHLSAEDWIRGHLHTPSGREFARTYIRGNAAIEPTETSLLGLLFALRSVGPARNLATAEALRIREGSHEVAKRLAQRVDDRIRFADPVRAITQDDRGVTVESDSCVLRCRRVAVCVPPPLAARISYTPALPDPRAGLLAGLQMGASVKFHAVYRRPFWRTRGLSGQAISAEGPVGLTYDNSPDDGTGRGVLVGLVVADAARRLSSLDRSGQQHQILESLRRLFGPDAAAPDELVIQDWNAEEWTRGCFAAHFPVGMWTSHGSAFRAPCARIHWAGTETASEWHGYMEGALRSGGRAAAEMLQVDEPDGCSVTHARDASQNEPDEQDTLGELQRYEKLKTTVRATLDDVCKVLGERHIGGFRHPPSPAFHRPDKVNERGRQQIEPLKTQLKAWSQEFGRVQLLYVVWEQTYEILQVSLAYNALRVAREAVEAFVPEEIESAKNSGRPILDWEADAMAALSGAMELITTEGYLYELINLSDANELKTAALAASGRAGEISTQLAGLLPGPDDAGTHRPGVQGLAVIEAAAHQAAVFYAAGALAAEAVIEFEKWLTEAPMLDAPDNSSSGFDARALDAPVDGSSRSRSSLTVVNHAIAEIEHVKNSLGGVIRQICEPWEQVLVEIREIMTVGERTVFVPDRMSIRYCYPFAVDLKDDGLLGNDDALMAVLRTALNRVNVTIGDSKDLGSSLFFYREKGHYGGRHVELQGGITVRNLPLRVFDDYELTEICDGEVKCKVWLELSDMGNHCLCIQPNRLSNPPPHELYMAVRAGTPFVIGETVVVNQPSRRTDEPSIATDEAATATEEITWDCLHSFSRDVIVAVAEGLLGSRHRGGAWFKAHFEPGNLQAAIAVQTKAPPRTEPRAIATALDRSVGGKILLRSTHQAASTLAEWLRYPPINHRLLPLMDETPVMGMGGDWFTNTGEMTVFGFVAAPNWQSNVYIEAAQFASSWSPLLRLWSRRLQHEIESSQPDAAESNNDGSELRRLEKKVRLHLMQIRAEDLCATRAHRRFLDQLLEMARLDRLQGELEAQLVATEHLTDWYGERRRREAEKAREREAVARQKDAEARQTAERRRNVLLAFITLLGIFGLTGFLGELDKDAGQNFLWLIPLNAQGMWENNLLVFLFLAGLALAIYFDIFWTFGLHDKVKRWFRETRFYRNARKFLGKDRRMTSTEPPVRDMRTEVSRSDIEQIYRELLEPSFGPDELDTIDSVLDGLTKGGSYEAWGLCVLDGETPVGCILGYPDEEAAVVLIGYLVVNRKRRSHGTGTALITEVRKRWFGDPAYTLVLAEVEDPRHHSVDRGSDPVRRVELYARQGMQVVVGPYFQPKLEADEESGEEKHRVYHLFLTVLNESNDPATWQDSVSGDQIADFLLGYFRSSGEGGDWPREDDEEGKQLLAFYRNRERIPLRPISEWEDIEIPELSDPS